MDGDVGFRKNVFLGVIGNILEWYDFGVYAFFAPILARLFFPAQNHTVALIKTFAIFALGYLVRPIGGILFGQIGDKVGRSGALRLSIIMMGIPSVLVGCLPIFDSIGVLAPILLLILRIIQGLAAGGELVGSTSYTYEIAPIKKLCFWGSWVTCSSLAGMLCGSLVSTVLHNIMTEHALTAWGWRIPFLLGIFLAGFGFWLRRYLDETKSFKKVVERKEICNYPVITAIKEAWPRIIQVVSINIFVSIAVYVLFVWMPTYTQTFLNMPARYVLLINTFAMLVLIILTPLMGLLSQYVGVKNMGLISAISIGLLSYPLFQLIIHGTLWGLLLAQLIFALCLSLVEGVLTAVMASLFKTQIRLSGVGLGYNISTSFFGGTAPLVCTFLLHQTGALSAPAYYMSLACIFGLIGFIFVKKGQCFLQKHRDLS